jgi:hypothetical protein
MIRPETMKTMKTQGSLEALYALIFAVCVLLALFLLVGCTGRDTSVAPSTHASVLKPRG